MRRLHRSTITSAVASFALVAAAAILRAELPTPLDQELHRIFERNEYASETFGPARWLDGGAAYVVLERTGPERAFIAYDTASGRRDVLADAASLTPAGASRPLDVADDADSRRQCGRRCDHDLNRLLA